MPQIDCIDEILIEAKPEIVFGVVSDYSNINKWFSIYSCEIVDADRIKEGVKVLHKYGYAPFILSRFIRQIDRIKQNSLLEESYIAGDLLGKGVWKFKQVGDYTKATYHCKVKSNNWIPAVSFLLMGKYAHSITFKPLLQKLKAHCESA